ncbi:MAG TPA: YetF domain-containing protein [Chryseosolibacter sp.]|nr:YetF domain-containing protein [Chryseosolibacter sp.]
MEKVFDWERILINDLPYAFLLEVLMRTAIMFTFLVIALRFTGKRGVKQLSIFEIVIIIAMGSAAGDPMFYEDVGILPALCTFVVVIASYRFVTWLTGKSRWFEGLLEGHAQLLIENGVFSVVKFKKEAIAQDEFFSELRLQSIDHLGQIRYAFLEPSGNISVFFFPDDEVKPGLPVIPSLFERKSATIPHEGIFSCANCGYTLTTGPGHAICPTCKREEWVESISTIRIT